jgi:hypothetical protein
MISTKDIFISQQSYIIRAAKGCSYSEARAEAEKAWRNKRDNVEAIKREIKSARKKLEG